MDIISRELVNEKEGRRDISEELLKLKDENTKLKEELRLVNERKIELQNNLKRAIEKRDKFQARLSQLEGLLREKALSFKELEDELSRIVEGKIPVSTERKKRREKEVSTSQKISTSQKAAPIELPPIVVGRGENSSEGSTRRKLEGEVLAVNSKDNFVIIDLGESAGVEKGFRFNVVRENDVIGTVEVIETRQEISAADIKTVISPFKDGDRVVLQ